MSIQTFLRPPPLPAADPPRLDGAAPPLDATTPAGRPRVVVFLRHVGCPFAEATVRALRARPEEHPAIDWVLVSHAPEGPTSRWLAEIGGAGGARVVVDPDRSLYAAWGLGLSDLGHFLGWRSLLGVAALFRRGIKNRRPSGTRWQRAGAFAVDDGGVIRWRHLPSHAGDLPDLAAAARALG
jgi:hypothetical protein